MSLGDHFTLHYRGIPVFFLFPFFDSRVYCDSDISISNLLSFLSAAGKMWVSCDLYFKSLY